MQAIYVATATYPASSAFIKIALLLQYLRVFSSPRIRIFCKIVLAITTISCLAFSVCSWFSCWPVSDFWSITILPQDARCWGFASRDKWEFIKMMAAQVVSAAILDLVVFLVPIRLLFERGTSRSTRLSLAGLFVVGFT